MRPVARLRRNGARRDTVTLYTHFTATFFVVDRPADDRFDEDAGEEECADPGQGAGEKAPPDDSGFHASVAGKAQQMPGVVEELVGIHVVAEHRVRSLVDADEIQHDEMVASGSDGDGLGV
jgi:hypothetical protein